MTPTETHLVIGLALAAPGALLVASVATLFQVGRWWRLAAVLAGLAAVLADLVLIYLGLPSRLPSDFPLFAWSPLGLYGVILALRVQADGLLLTLPVLVLAAAGVWFLRLHGSAAGTGGSALALVALAAALQVSIAGDLVSLFLAVALFVAAGVGTLWSVAGARAAGQRAMAACAAGLGLLVCVLVLGEVNGLFQLAQLSTAGVTAAPLAGVLLATAVAMPIPPFHGWLLRVARHPLAPALGVAGNVVGLVLLLTVFRVTAGEFSPAWQQSLGAAGWLCVAVSTGVALVRRAATVRLAALLVGHDAYALFAAAVATPASMAAAVLYVLLAVPVAAVLWLVVRVTPVSATHRQAGRLAPARQPGFWLFALLLATAVGIPGTAGGLARSALAGALTSWPSGDQFHRLPLFIVDAATLVVGGSLLWQRAWFPRLQGLVGWVVLAAAVVILVVPVALPGYVVGSWLGLAAARAAGTAGSPLAVGAATLPSLFSVLLGLLAVWALAQSVRGREWLPGPARAAMGTAALGWAEARRAWSRGGLGSLPAQVSDSAQRALQAIAGRALDLLRPLEERYYAAGAVMLAVAVIYIIGR